MSEQSKEAAQKTNEHLKTAEQHLQQAEKSSQGTGDKSLTQKIKKLSEGASETRKELDKNLDH
jgi:hypothetical protein